jgi:acetyl-CoA C-acetyltransferase
VKVFPFAAHTSNNPGPHMLEKSRQGFKYGDVTLTDHVAYDGL